MKSFSAAEKSIIETMRSDRCTYHEIAESVDRSLVSIGDYCRKNGLAYSEAELKKQTSHQNAEDAVAERIRNLNRHIVYISGYTGRYSKITVRHLDCGHEFQRVYHGLFFGSTNPVRCPVCDKQRKASMAAVPKGPFEKNCDYCGKSFLANSRNARFCCKNCRYRQHLVDQHNQYASDFISEKRECKYCGKIFTTSFKGLRDYCSKRCSRKVEHKATLQRRIKYIGQIVDKDITLPKLYERDGGVCYLCGEKTDWNDKHKNASGHWVYGNHYPSIDHIVPLAKLGRHSWDNVKLACRYCNSVKCDSEPGEVI